MATQKKPSILDTIAARRRLDVLRARQRAPEAALKDLAAATAPPLDLYAHVLRAAGERGVALAAEFKRCSPSKGDIAVGIDAGEQALRYQAGGASVVSVLTEPTWFKGSLEDLQRVRRALESAAAADAAAETAGEKREEPGPRPNTRAAVLRKDFIVDAYQLLEARAHGADTTLLIVAILSDALLAYMRCVQMAFEQARHAARAENVLPYGGAMGGSRVRAWLKKHKSRTRLGQSQNSNKSVSQA